MSIIIYGNVVDGMGFIGPFDDTDAANDYADLMLGNTEWWVVELEEPNG